MYCAGPPFLSPLIHKFSQSIFITLLFSLLCIQFFPCDLSHSHLFQYPPLQKGRYPYHLLYVLLLLFSIGTFVLFCFCNPIRHCNHHHNPSCHPCLLHNSFSLLDLLTKWMLLLYFSVCYFTSSLWH
jgi:hypothetical protein